MILVTASASLTADVLTSAQLPISKNCRYIPSAPSCSAVTADKDEDTFDVNDQNSIITGMFL